MIVVKSARADAPEFLPLHEARTAYAKELYPAESNHLLDLASMCKPEMNFFGAWDGQEAVGCGGFWEYATYVEIKSMWVVPKARGQKIGRHLLEVVEREAAAKGYKIARLETGIHQPEALALYHKHGYREVGPFEDYKPDALSVFMEKIL